MFIASPSCSEMSDPVFNQHEVRTKFWGVTCKTGLRYNQVVEKKYCITRAVLDPHSDTDSDYVSVMFMYDQDEEYIMAVLKHGEINQVSLNIHFDRENVSFYLKGKGTVHLLGHEILDSSVELYNETGSSSPTAEAAKLKKIKNKKRLEDKHLKSRSDTVIPKREKKIKQHKQSHSEDEQESPQTSFNKGVRNTALDFLDEDDDDEDDDDFSIQDEEEEEDDEDSDDDVEEEIEDSEIEKLEEDLEDMEEIPEPPSSRRKRKQEEAQQSQKRAKTERSPVKKVEETISVDDDDSSDTESESEDSDAAAAKSRTSKKIPTSEAKSAEKMKILEKQKKKKMKKLEENKSRITLNKSQQTTSPVSKKLEDGLEIEDIKIGHGPAVAKGKMLHVFYIGRFADKTIFDSRTRGCKPFSFVYGMGKVIKGWDVGLEGMRAGGKRKLKVPPSMGYGRAALEGIPANSTLYFVVEVIAVT